MPSNKGFVSRFIEKAQGGKEECQKALSTIVSRRLYPHMLAAGTVLRARKYATVTSLNFEKGL